jgi:hypothetical protein
MWRKTNGSGVQFVKQWSVEEKLRPLFDK